MYVPPLKHLPNLTSPLHPYDTSWTSCHQLTPGLMQCSPNWFSCVSSRCSIKPILFTWTRGISQRQKADQVTVLLHTLWRPYHDPLAWMIWPLCMVSKLISSTLFIPTPPDTQIPSLCLQHDKPIFPEGRSLNAHSACYSFAHSSFLLAPSGFSGLTSSEKPSWPLVYKKPQWLSLTSSHMISLIASWLYNFILFISLLASYLSYLVQHFSSRALSCPQCRVGT